MRSDLVGDHIMQVVAAPPPTYQEPSPTPSSPLPLVEADDDDMAEIGDEGAAAGGAQAAGVDGGDHPQAPAH
jgi:hypothetical protein